MTTTPKTALPDFETVAQRARETNDRFTDAGRKVTTAYLDGIEKYVAGFTALERKVAAQPPFELFAGLIDAHAKITDDVVKASVAATRELIAV